MFQPRVLTTLSNPLCSRDSFCDFKTVHLSQTSADGEFGGTLNDPLTLYAVNGFYDIHISGSAGSYREGIMYCDDDYNSSCSINGDNTNEWQCDTDQSDFCNLGQSEITAQSIVFNNKATTSDVNSAFTWKDLEMPLIICMYLAVCVLGVVFCSKADVLKRSGKSKGGRRRARRRQKASITSNECDIPTPGPSEQGTSDRGSSDRGSSDRTESSDRTGSMELGSSDGNYVGNSVSPFNGHEFQARVRHRVDESNESMEIHSGDGSASSRSSNDKMPKEPVPEQSPSLSLITANCQRGTHVDTLQ